MSTMQSQFDLANAAQYERWRDHKRATHPVSARDLIVDVADPRDLTSFERKQLLALCERANMAIYRSAVQAQDKEIPRRIAAQLGLHRLDGNWLADEDGISPITVADTSGQRSAFIPYTNRAIKWHTDGYYHPQARCIRAMVLHCVRCAKSGGASALMDHEMAYIAMREANPDWVRAMMQPDAMTIPQRQDDDGIARAEQAGPVFSVDRASNSLHMRYTARTRSVVWKDDEPTRGAVAFLEQMLATERADVFRLTLQPGMGLVCNNVLHDRSGFIDDPLQPRLLYRARYTDRISEVSDKELTCSPREMGFYSY